MITMLSLLEPVYGTRKATDHPALNHIIIEARNMYNHSTGGSLSNPGLGIRYT